MAALAEIIDFLDELLDPGAFDDYGPNGLQVPGAAEVDEGRDRRLRPARAVRARGREPGAQLVLCHHGIFWDFHAAPITPAMKRAAEGAVRRTTCRSRPTTCRSTPTPRSATTR